jgi:DNA-binding CsgD family transcriptional regulator
MRNYDEYQKLIADYAKAGKVTKAAVIYLSAIWKFTALPWTFMANLIANKPEHTWDKLIDEELKRLNKPVSKALGPIDDVISLGSHLWPSEYDVIAGQLKQYYGLSRREVEALWLLSLGLPYKVIGQKMTINDTTTKSHMNKVFQKMLCNDKIQIAVLAHAHGFPSAEMLAGHIFKPDQQAFYHVDDILPECA